MFASGWCVWAGRVVFYILIVRRSHFAVFLLLPSPNTKNYLILTTGVYRLIAVKPSQLAALLSIVPAAGRYLHGARSSPPRTGLPPQNSDLLSDRLHAQVRTPPARQIKVRSTVTATYSV